MGDDDMEAFLRNVFGGKEEPTPELPSQLTAAEMTDEHILAEIRAVLSGERPIEHQKLSPRARDLGLHILDKGWVTPSMERRRASQGEHVWQAKSELNQVIHVCSRERHPESNEAMYKFDLDRIRKDGQVVREGDITRTLTAKQRREIEARFNHECVFCHSTGVKLQIEHLVPFLIGGNFGGVRWLAVACASCNRRKGFYCKRCPNWTERDLEVCKRCFWASTDDSYSHMGTVPQRVVLETFSDPQEVAKFEQARSKLSAREALLFEPQ